MSLHLPNMVADWPNYCSLVCKAQTCLFLSSRSHQMYYMFGFLFLVFIILVITCSEATILLCYFHLCAEVNSTQINARPLTLSSSCFRDDINTDIVASKLLTAAVFSQYSLSIMLTSFKQKSTVAADCGVEKGQGSIFLRSGWIKFCLK